MFATKAWTKVERPQVMRKPTAGPPRAPEPGRNWWAAALASPTVGEPGREARADYFRSADAEPGIVPRNSSPHGPVQRKCACGSAGEECAACGGDASVAQRKVGG